MKIVGVLSQKGGVGKTTAVMSLAACLAEQLKVLVVDVDPQRSASWWADRAGEELPFDVADDTEPANLSRLRDLPYDLVLVDTPGSLEGTEVLSTVLAGSDFAVLPTEPAPLAIAPLITTIEDVVRPQGIDFRVLVSRADPRLPADVSDAFVLLDRAQIPHFRSFVRSYKLHSTAPVTGQVVTQFPDYGSGAKAMHDYRSVAAELLTDLGLN